jgi:ACT domain-containing protein
MNAVGQSNRAIITVLGKDQVGIIAWVSSLLARHNANILDISQTIMQEFFTMIMIVDLAGAEVDLSVLREILSTQGKVKGLTVTVQHEDVFQFMHRI